MASSKIAIPQSLHPLSRVLAALVLAGLAVAAAAVLAAAQSPVSCKYHRGSFSNDFTTEFDISRRDCRIADSVTIRLWAAPPYVGVKW